MAGLWRRIALHHSSESPFLFGVCGLTNFVGALFWAYNLRRILCGEQAEYVFVPFEKRESSLRILLDHFCCTSIAILIGAVSIWALFSLGPTHSFAQVSTVLLLNIAAWRGAYQAWTCDRAYKKEPKVKFASDEAAERARALEKAEKVPVAIGVNGRGPTGHWWTDTQLREENKSDVGR